MLYDIAEVKVEKNYVLYLRFENGVEGKVNVSEIVPFKGVFTRLQDKDYFATVHVNSDWLC